MFNPEDLYIFRQTYQTDYGQTTVYNPASGTYYQTAGGAQVRVGDVSYCPCSTIIDLHVLHGYAHIFQNGPNFYFFFYS